MQNKQRIKILLVIYGDIHFGGVSVIINNLLSNMNKDNFDFTLYAFGKVVDEDVYRFYKENGVRIIVGGHETYNRKLITKDLLSIIFKGKYDIVHCNTGGLELTYLTMAVAKMFGVKKRIAHSHNTSNARRPYIKRELWWQRRIDRLATIKLTCSEAASMHLFGNASARLLCNGINVSKFTFDEETRSRARKQLGIDGKIVLGTVGRMEGVKNQLFILDIANALSQHDEVAVVIVGDGSLKQKTVEYSEKLGLSDNSVFVDVNDSVEYYLNAMDIFLLPSYAEGLPLSAIEAQSMDLPIWCSTNVPSQVAITEKAFFLEIDDGAEKWSDDIYNYCKSHNLKDRRDNSYIIRENGYDIKESAKMLHDIYML